MFYYINYFRIRTRTDIITFNSFNSRFFLPLQICNMKNNNLAILPIRHKSFYPVGNKCQIIYCKSYFHSRFFINSLTQPSPPFFVIIWMLSIAFTSSQASAGQAFTPTLFSRSIQFTSSPI